jgi:hypothetical protein
MHTRKKKSDYAATNREYGNHFGSTIGMCRSGETKRPIKYPVIETHTKARRGNKDHWIIGH